MTMEDRLYRQSEDIRKAISLSQEACSLISGTMIVPEAESALEMIYEDFGAVIDKLTASLAAMDAVEVV